MMGEIKKETKLTVAAFSKRLASGGWQRRAIICLDSRGKEGSQRGRQDSSLIEKGCGEKILGMVGEIKKETKLTVAAFSKRLASGGWRRRDVMPLVE
jgi:hypothetical protein